MSKRNESQFKGYPIYIRPNAKGTIEVLDGADVYKWVSDDNTNGRWMAVLLCKSTYPKWGTDEMQTSIGVKLFVWTYGERKNYKGRDSEGKPIMESTGEYFWKEVGNMPINKQEYWDKISKAMEKFAPELPE